MAAASDTRRKSDQAGAKRRPDPLENGDLLTASEFLFRYEAMSQVKKAELIEGVVYMGSPVRLIHGKPDSLMQTWLGVYAARTPGTEVASNVTVRFDADNVFQPDVFLRLLPDCGGRSRVDADGYLSGPPELVVEIAASSASIDLRDKLRVYRRSDVREYLVWRTTESQFDWFVLETDEYKPNTVDAQGLLQSRAFPGLCLDVEALLALNSAKVLAVLQTRLQSKGHEEFVGRLKEASKSGS